MEGGLGAAYALTASLLAQVWSLVAGDNPALTKPQFYSTLRLISLAQVSHGFRLHYLCELVTVSPEP